MTRTKPLMQADPRLLTLMQWLSPAYPLGSFAFSHGLESAVRAGWVLDAESLENWLADLLTDGSGHNDAILLRLAHAAPGPDALDDINATARALSPSTERLREAERQGTAFARVTGPVWSIDLPDLLLAVAVGRAAGLLNLDADITTMLYLQSFASNLTSAAQRLMPLGQTEAQRTLSRLAPLCQRLVTETVGAGPSDLYSNTFLSDVAAMTHETLQPRLFQS
ncbi:MAG: urease accessory protein UreF [Roseovarius sp.]